MRKKAAALVLCLLLVAQLAAPSAGASENVYFVAVGGNVLPLSDATMPFWSGGYLYVSSTIFTGIVWSSLGISHVPANAKQPLILYSSDDQPLMFDLSRSYAQDADGNTYYPGAVQRNGVTFVPVALVASFFDLQYSLIDNVEHGSLVWLRKPGYGLTAEQYANAAAYSMASCYARYLRSKEQEQTTTVQPPAQTEPETPAATASGKRLYLCLEAGENTAALLDVLDGSGVQAAFFCSQSFLESQGDLVRRMTATGYAVGLLVDGASEDRSVAEQLEAGNQALYRAACVKTRLARIENGDTASVQTAEAQGFRCLQPDLDRSAYGLHSTSNAEALLKRVSSRRGDVTVWLADTADSIGLRAFVKAAKEAGSQCLALTETV